MKILYGKDRFIGIKVPAVMVMFVLAAVLCRAATVEPQLAPKPDVLAKLAQLGDNASVVLEDTTIITDGLGDFAKGWHNMPKTGPAGRDFTIKMVWMSDRKRAFFCGANHGSPHRFNDAWEYDLAANTWVLLYVPDHNDRGKFSEEEFANMVLTNGWLRTRKGGGPVHVAHTWWGLTYNPISSNVLWYCAWPKHGLFTKVEALGHKREELFQGPPVWSFRPQERKWEPIPTTKLWPRDAFGASLEYIPELQGSLWQYYGASWLLDDVKGTWREMEKSKVGLPIETVVCYDTSRQLLIAQRGPVQDSEARTWHNQLKDGALGGWQVVQSGGEQPNGHDARSLMYYDPRAKMALQYDRTQQRMWSYDPAESKWQLQTPQGPPPPFTEQEIKRAIGYFDEEHNVFVVIGFGRVWCYRYRK
jgi:hypothetical protein